MNVLYEQGLESVAGELSQMGFSMHPLRAAVRAMSAGEIAGAIRRRSVQPLF